MATVGIKGLTDKSRCVYSKYNVAMLTGEKLFSDSAAFDEVLHAVQQNVDER